VCALSWSIAKIINLTVLLQLLLLLIVLLQLLLVVAVVHSVFIVVLVFLLPVYPFKNVFSVLSFYNLCLIFLYLIVRNEYSVTPSVTFRLFFSGSFGSGNCPHSVFVLYICSLSKPVV